MRRSALSVGRKSLERGSTFASERERAANCETCGADFVSRPTHLGWTRFCSRGCSGVARRRRETRTCKVCGTTFEVVVSRRNSTCSDACSRVAKSTSKTGTRNPNYKPPEECQKRWWEAQASNCVACGTDQAMHMHHVVYRREVARCGGDCWDPRNGMTLCPRCHMRHHNAFGGALPLALVPTSAFEFAAELLGPGRAYEYLRRRYAGDDQRLDALLRDYEAKEAA